MLPARARGSVIGLLTIAAFGLIGRSDAHAADAQNPGPPVPLKFDDTGAQVGDQLPNLPIYDLDGKSERLVDPWSYRAALLLTSSLTCPQSRSSYPRAEALATRVGDELPVNIIYVLGAHPKGDSS